MSIQWSTVQQHEKGKKGEERNEAGVCTTKMNRQYVMKRAQLQKFKYI